MKLGSVSNNTCNRLPGLPPFLQCSMVSLMKTATFEDV